jgi:hypothetical protein
MWGRRETMPTGFTYPDWQDVALLPECDPFNGRPAVRLLFYSKQLGIHTGEGGRFHTLLFANIASFHGNAIEHWGVTDFMPLPTPPAKQRVTEMAHTPTPWGIERTRYGLWVGPMRPDGNKVDGIVFHMSYGVEYTADHNKRQDANAELIVAAVNALARDGGTK